MADLSEHLESRDKLEVFYVQYHNFLPPSDFLFILCLHTTSGRFFLYDLSKTDVSIQKEKKASKKSSRRFKTFTYFRQGF